MKNTTSAFIKINFRNIDNQSKSLLLILTVSILAFISSCKKPAEEFQKNNDVEISSGAATSKGQTGINILLNRPVTDAILNDLKGYGTIKDIIHKINALTMITDNGNLSLIKKLSYVSAANPDAERNGSPVDAVPVADFTGGISTWNLDAINVTDSGKGRTIAETGEGVYVGVLDSGLPDTWRQYFPEERIAEQYAISFGGGGRDVGNVSDQPNKWEHDQNSHGVHVTSTIIGFKLGTRYVNGVAPKATIIPVKVLSQRGSGWSSVIARGIVYIADLKAGPLANSPVVINMSLGGLVLDAVEKAAVDYAISKGVIIAASAGNRGENGGMSYPGAYPPVICSAASGWVDQWKAGNSWWFAADVPNPTKAEDFFIAPFSSRSKPGQDIDVAAPGEWIVGPYQESSGKVSYFFLSGTSMASPHTAGIVALMAQKKPTLTAAQAETALESAAIPIGPGSRSILDPDTGNTITVSWGDNAAGNGLITADAALNAVN